MILSRHTRAQNKERKKPSLTGRVDAYCVVKNVLCCHDCWFQLGYPDCWGVHGVKTLLRKLNANEQTCLAEYREIVVCLIAR